MRREVAEEASVPVGPVQILGSQPWPIGACYGFEIRGCLNHARHSHGWAARTACSCAWPLQILGHSNLD